MSQKSIKTNNDQASIKHETSKRRLEPKESSILPKEMSSFDNETTKPSTVIRHLEEEHVNTDGRKYGSALTNYREMRVRKIDN